jgi:aspartate kinase
VAQVSVSSNKAIVSLIADVSRSSFILSETFTVLEREQVNIQMLSQGCSKVKFSFVVDDAQSNRCVQLLHNHFFK